MNTLFGKQMTRNIITYSWGKTSHGICGHLFEAFELFYNLNLDNKPSILLIGDQVDFKTVIGVLYDKYSKIVVNKYFSYMIFKTPKIISTKGSVIITDGVIPNCIIEARDINLILCSKKSKNDESKFNNLLTNKPIKIFYDTRLKHNLEPYIDNNKRTFQFMNLVKQIDTKLFRDRDPFYIKPKEKLGFIYATTNCRQFDEDQIENINEIIETNGITKINFVIDTKDDCEEVQLNFTDKFNCTIDIINPKELPIPDLLYKTSIYIYTSTSKKWDCSSRLLVECSYFGIKVLFTDKVKEYLEEDTGLYTRIKDLDNDPTTLYGKNNTILDNIERIERWENNLPN